MASIPGHENPRLIARGVRLHKPLDPLLDNFFLLLRRGYRRAADEGKGLEFYRASAGVLDRFYAEPWIRRTLFPIEIARIRRFLAVTGIQVPDPRSLVQRSLFGYSWARIWGETLQGLKREEFGSIASVLGKEHLAAALASGRGVVLVHSHSWLAELFWRWLDDQGIARGVTLWEWSFRRTPGEKKNPKIRVVEGAREMRKAMDTLRQGGIVHVMGDGVEGERKIEIPVFNRIFSYRPVFAELALTAGAMVLPVLVILLAQGKLSIQIGAPFTDGPGQASLAERIEALVRQYAQHKEQTWRAFPDNVRWNEMKRYLSLPSPGAGTAPIDERAFVDKRDLIRVRAEKDPELRKAIAHSIATHRRKDNLGIGDVVPQLGLAAIAGGPNFDLAIQKHRPLVLLLGSHSCPPFRRACREQQEMAELFKDSADFLIIYVEEAHPVGEWQPHANAADNVHVARHASISDRIAAARRCAKELGIRIQMGVDDMENTANGLFAAWPVRIYILGSKREVLYRGRPGPYDFRLDEARIALDALLSKVERA